MQAEDMDAAAAAQAESAAAGEEQRHGAWGGQGPSVVH